MGNRLQVYKKEVGAYCIRPDSVERIEKSTK